MNQRKTVESARSEWALCHGLEPDDGAYLGELRKVALTVTELSAALAICGQTPEMVQQTVGRLIARGFLEQVPPDEPRRAGPFFERVRQELASAEIELEILSCELESNHTIDQRVFGASLRQAVYRVVVARRFLESLTGQV